ncbi:MAG: hypothetical protein WC071_05010 [Victivallaceae bacterium]
MDLTVVLVGVVMFVALVGMIICSKKQKTNPNAQPIAIGLLIIVIICGIVMMQKTGIFGGGGAEQFQKIENQYYASQGFVIGKFIAKNFSGQKVLVIADPGFEKDLRVNGLVDAIKQGAGESTNVVVDTIQLANKPKQQEGAPMDMPLFELMTAKDFDSALASHSDCTVVISTVGLPRDAGRMKLWNMPEAKRPKLILMGIPDPTGMKAAITKGLISAIVTISPTAKFTEDAPPSDLQETFNLRYVLIDKDNLSKYANLLN